MSKLLQGLPKSIQMGREYALLGHYDTAITYFNGAVKTIDQYLRTISDRSVIQQWKRAKEDLTIEVKLMHELENIAKHSSACLAARPT